uniref:Thymic stromal cotransporter homolog n=1 Tax=Callorhinchus milii TaxID=7868 RepID=A0A4W3JP93_CALMI|eukprot:gi/632949612/ref/XP_007890253.1/ PREDICTED: thymic stromal cotransporter homolog [Callorhinchus milii]
MTRFFMIYHILSKLITLFSTFYFAKLEDFRSRKIIIVVPLLGCLISRSLLLFVIFFDLPLEVIFATASLDGLSGGFTTYWTAVVVLVCSTSSEKRRSIRLITTDFAYGLAGFVGSILSGYIFLHLKILHYHGIILVALSLALYVVNLFYCILVLKIPPKQQKSGPQGDKEQNEESDTFTEKLQCDSAGHLVKHEHVTGDIQHKNRPPVEKTEHKTARVVDDKNGRCVNGQCCKAVSRIFDGIIRDNWSSWWADGHGDKGTLWFMVGAAVLYDMATKGAMDVLPIFVLNWPLKWNAVLLGYGNASEYAIYFTSFLTICLFSKCVKDTSLIVIGMLSFSAGMLVMGFVKWTYLYFVA